MNLRTKQNGVTVLEILVVLVILSFAILGASTLVDNYTQQMRLALTAQHMNQFGNAVQAYIKDNYQDVASKSTSTKPFVITALTLNTASAKYLPPNFNPLNSYNQTICALVLQPTIGGTAMLTTLIVTENGTAPNDLDLGQLAGLIGAAGGGIYTDDPTTTIVESNIAMGTMGRWKFDLTSDPVGKNFSGHSVGNCTTGNLGTGTVTLTPGHPLMALWFNNETSSAYLYRDQVANHPELNSMQTNLVFNPAKNATLELNNISVYESGSATNPVQITDGLACGYSAAVVDYTGTAYTTIGPLGSTSYPPQPFQDSSGNLVSRPPIHVGTLGTDSNGAVLYCQDVNGDGTVLKWKTQGSLFWGDPVDYYTNNPMPSGATSSNTFLNTYPCSTATPPPVTVGVTHVVLHPAVGTNPRAYTCAIVNNTAQWLPLAVDDQGILQLGSPPPSATERKAGDSCSAKGIVSMNSSGQLLTCQNFPTSTSSLLWVNSSVGNFHFYIQGYPNDPMVGVGVKNVVNGKITFSGTLHCDPNVVYDPIWTIPHQSCGSGGTMVCTNNNNFAPGWGLPSNANASLESCAYYNAMGSQPTWANYQSWDNYGYSTMPLNIDVVNLQVEISQPMIQTW